ncbi:MAG: LuxR C-terminal-related transcriptional regulator [Hellea sp.]
MKTAHSRGRPPHQDTLTPSEWKVVEGIRHGLTNPQIAEKQDVSLNAIKFHVANILVKLSLKNRSELRIWQGIRADSNLSKKSKGEALMDSIKIQSLGQVARNVTDVEKATDWFRDILGLEHLYSFGDLSFFNCMGTRIFLNKGNPKTNSILYFAVENIHQAHVALISRNVDIISAPHMIHKHDDGTEEWMSFFNDMDGQPLGLMSRLVTAKNQEANNA